MYYCKLVKNIYTVTDENDEVVWSNTGKSSEHFSHYCSSFMTYANDMNGLEGYLQAIGVIEVGDMVAYIYCHFDIMTDLGECEATINKIWPKLCQG